MIRAFIRRVRDRNMNRGFGQIRAFVAATDGLAVLELTPEMARAYDRDARSYASRRAHAIAEARRLKSHRLMMEVSVLRGMA